MKKLLTILLSILMVVTIGTVNVFAAQGDIMGLNISGVATTNGSAKTTSLASSSITVTVEGAAPAVLPTATATITYTKKDDTEKFVNYTDTNLIPGNYKATIVVTASKNFNFGDNHLKKAANKMSNFLVLFCKYVTY